jgi:predicted nucleic acid-binding protein
VVECSTNLESAGKRPELSVYIEASLASPRKLFYNSVSEKYFLLALVIKRVASVLLGIIIEFSNVHHIYFMQSKSLLIAIAAFAVTTSGVFAYTGDNVLQRANLSADQKTAITRARELRENGNYSAARDSLLNAGIDEQVLKRLHEAKHQVEREMHAALVAGDYDAFIASIAQTPLADIIITEDDFELFRSAQDLKDGGDYTAAKEIYDELGVQPKPYRHGHGKGFAMQELSVEQREAFAAARQANDKATMQAVLDKAGVYRPMHY